MISTPFNYLLSHSYVILSKNFLRGCRAAFLQLLSFFVKSSVEKQEVGKGNGSKPIVATTTHTPLTLMNPDHLVFTSVKSVVVVGIPRVFYSAIFAFGRGSKRSHPPGAWFFAANKIEIHDMSVLRVTSSRRIRLMDKPASF